MLSDAEICEILLKLQLTRKTLKAVQDRRLSISCSPPTYLVRLNMGTADGGPERYMGAQVGALRGDDITLAGVEPEICHGQPVPGNQHTYIRYVSNHPFEPHELSDLVRRLRSGTLIDAPESVVRTRAQEKEALTAAAAPSAW